MNLEEALVITETVLKHERLNKVQELVFRQSWEGHSYKEIAQSSEYDAGYVKDAGYKLWQLLSKAFGEKVTKHNLQSVLRRYAQRSHSAAAIQEISPSTGNIEENRLSLKMGNGVQLEEAAIASPSHQDWGEAIDVSDFYDRAEELATLERWIVRDRCRVVTLFGMGGMGKTALSVKLAEQIQGNFDYVIWRSLLHAPSPEDFLADAIAFLSDGQVTELPKTIEGRVSQLINYLRQHRCLLILDNAETILCSGHCTGCYQEGYQGYHQLLKGVAETPHKSTLILTSREKLKDLEAREGTTLPIRSLQLRGLPPAEGRKIFQDKGTFYGSEDDWKLLIEHYAGNPLALKMVAPAIRDLLGSSIPKFLNLLNQEILVFDDIRNLLDRQLDRLTHLEKVVMYWLAIRREPISFFDLQADLVPKIPLRELLETLASLQRRSLIEKAALIETNSEGFTQQPVVMEYMTEQFINQVCREITTGKIALFSSHALLQAPAKDYIRDMQVRLILKPIAEQLLATFENPQLLEHQFELILSSVREKPVRETGYTAGNIINLLQQMQTDFSNWDFSDLTVWRTAS